MHILELDTPILLPQDGLLLGNGDISVSVYQKAHRLVWRFGKNDVWDRRVDRSRDPMPPHIDEIARGINEEGWQCDPYGGGTVKATRGSKDTERMHEICTGVPPSFQQPYPCPKPVGELELALPPDLTGMTICQRLRIEDATLEIVCSWPVGVKLTVVCVIPPSPNVLVLHWTLEGWNERTQIGLLGVGSSDEQHQPLWFALHRWPDPAVNDFNARFYGEYRAGGAHFATKAFNPTTLPPPSTRLVDKQWIIEQAFPPDPLFKEGFRYWLAPVHAPGKVEHVPMSKTGEARLHLQPPDDRRDGWLSISVTSSRDEGGPEKEWQRIRDLVASTPDDVLQRWEMETRAAAAVFWSKSALTVANPMIENTWYETLYSRRCTYRSDTVTPGLYLPSTVQDYSLWHGDYHTNYNLQEPFWGDNTANHVELGDAFFHAMQYFWPIGQKIARDYYGCRGVFIQLSSYPCHIEDDPIGAVPMGRMAYMTGWVVSHYWLRYRYSMDVKWLRATGYPAIRDCACFYTDFLKKGADGLYHAFPSNQGEDGFTGEPKAFTDRPQVLQHVRYCLRVALEASRVLGTDEELREAWKDRLEHCAGDDGQPPDPREARADFLDAWNPPEWRWGLTHFDFARHRLASPSTEPWPARGDYVYDWYFAHYPWLVMQPIRTGRFAPDDGDFARFANMLRRWRRPNGLFSGMSLFWYGPCGAFNESAGILAPLQDMLLQSWDGVIRIFPAWPKHVDVAFKQLRAEGAFLVSAAWSGGRVTQWEIQSERGGSCRLAPGSRNVRVTDPVGATIPVTSTPNDEIIFETLAGETYCIQSCAS